MRVKMRTTAAGPQGNFMADTLYEIPDALAKDFIDGGYAVATQKPVTPKAEGPDMEEARPIETADAPKGETPNAGGGETATAPQGETAAPQVSRRRGRA